jgi:23S rRNA-/tRNA-specific pseudouridylate synthase
VSASASSTAYTIFCRGSGIRVQAASRRHPVIGDAQYGSTFPFGEQFENERLRAIALHARQLGFNHPMTNEPVDVIAPLPAAWDAFGLLRP